MLHLRAFVVLKTQVTMNLFLVISFLTVANPVISNGSALRMVLEMIQMTPEMTTTTITMMMTNFLMPQKS